MHIIEWPLIVTSPKHTSALMMLFNYHLDMLYLSGRWFILAKEKCSLTQIIFCLKSERNNCFVHKKSIVLLQLMRNVSKGCVYSHCVYLQCVAESGKYNFTVTNNLVYVQKQT